MRLALTYSGLLTASGAVLLTLTAVIIIWFPTYSFTPSEALSVLPDNAASLPVSPLKGEASDLSIPSVKVTSTEDLMQLFLIVSAGLMLAVAVLGGFIGWKVAGKMLAPLHEVSAAAKQAASGHLDHRIGLGTPRDEITELANTFDEMLSSLETAFHAHQRFAANASHELRTPLATTRAMLDVALATGTPASRDLLVGLREMNERNVETVDALLALADIEAVPGATDALCDMASITASSAAALTSLFAECGIDPSLDLAAATTSGDARLLRLLVDNLLSNAARHNVEGGFVAVRTGVEQGEGFLRVENSGPTITAEQALQLTEPFVRLQGRGAGGQGHGLGLAIVAAIVRYHRADLSLEPRGQGGLVVTVRFPLARD
ncbi:HAMP domain-containing histidine kinase [Leucobacter sp. UCMA 4100]|uniref:sensor histidine kinase n=1 Tax=Leucobacter sp. UCMA 4100 TaxID=2810534 RepID=UPI0022EB695A|nr:HAMP domain-containing sensor histidine kinase [Leucobacter sp. UCMA 4100]MDA3147189.1 HAMP domain-containing histidine kinase [Leucobacter sp. UCMA 4100]